MHITIAPLLTGSGIAALRAKAAIAPETQRDRARSH
jgi:hypothetical protein